jgi:hypothetical protein
MPKLTDTQLVLLNAANARYDGCLLPIPKSVKARGAALDRALTSLLRAGLVAETAAGKDQPVWKTGTESGAVTLTLTDAGRAVLDLDAGPGETTRHRRARTKKAIARPDEKASRSATIMRLLSRKSGASIEDLTEATGWQAHSVRGFLSGTIRKRMGLNLLSEADSAGKRRYRLAETPNREARA